MTNPFYKDPMVENYDNMTRLPQRQDSLAAQLQNLAAFANKLGMHDAADFLNAAVRNKGEGK